MRRSLIVLSVAAGLAAAAPASASSTQAETGKGGAVTHCVTVIEKLAPGERESRIVERTCTTDAQKLVSMKASMNFRSLLVQYFEHPDHQGASDSIYGWGGSCDASGYGIPSTAPFENRISSWYTYGTCDHVQAFEGGRYGGDSLSFHSSKVNYPRHKDARGNWIGKDMNDIVRSVWVKDA